MLIIVLWVCFGLVALVIYFANSMSSELRAADNRYQETASRLALEGGERYVGYVLTQYATSGTVPKSTEYYAEALPVGDAYFWIIGRDNNQEPTSSPVFGLVDEASKLNLNRATVTMLEALPWMTTDFAASIYDWRSTSAEASAGGAKDEVYARMDPPRRCKSSPFETTDELRLVYGSTLELLLGEDANRNGFLDPNEDDSTASPPKDDQNGRLQPGILEYVTAMSSQPNTRSDGNVRVNVGTLQSRPALQQLLAEKISQQRATAVIEAISGRTFSSVAEFLVASGLTEDEFAKIHTDVTVSTARSVVGLVNVNTASATVLACLPGMNAQKAASLVAYRLAHTDDSFTSFAWITKILDSATITAVGPYITDQSYQFSADIAAVSRTGRGYCRERVIFDMSSGTPRIVYRQDLTAYGWALGADARKTLKENIQGGRL